MNCQDYVTVTTDTGTAYEVRYLVGTVILSGAADQLYIMRFRIQHFRERKKT
jgi:hypothetical protein